MKIYINNIPNIDYIEGSLEEIKDILCTWVDVTTIPESLGNNMQERLQNYMKYREKGIILIDSKE